MDVRRLEQLSNEAVGAAAKALILTWAITAEEVLDGEADETHKVAGGVAPLLRDQAEDRDTELTIHSIGYASMTPGTHHDHDSPQTPAEHDAVVAHMLLARCLAEIVEALQGGAQ
jgi:hypothetical protein